MSIKGHAWWGGKIWEIELREKFPEDGKVMEVAEVRITTYSYAEKRSLFHYGDWDDIILHVSPPLPFDLVDRLGWSLDVKLGGPRARGLVRKRRFPDQDGNYPGPPSAPSAADPTAPEQE